VTRDVGREREQKMTFYDFEGTPVAYCDDGEAIYLYTGEPMAYLDTDSVYAYSGRHLDFFVDGWVRDHHDCASSLPKIPRVGLSDPFAVLHLSEASGECGLCGAFDRCGPLKPFAKLGWSPLSGISCSVRRAHTRSRFIVPERSRL
jgi:hypothetical protein